jgi:hypothetical protein
MSLLNEANEEVLKAHKSPTRQVLLGGQDVLPFSAATDMFKSEERLLAGDILEEPTEEGPSKKLRRTIKGVNRLSMVAYNDEDSDEDNDAGSNYSSNDDTESETTNEEDFETEVEFSSIQPNAIKQLKKIYKQQTQDIQEAFNQEELNLRLLLSLYLDQVYVVEDLQE